MANTLGSHTNIIIINDDVYTNARRITIAGIINICARVKYSLRATGVALFEHDREGSKLH
jgi:hypothetical protein